MASDGGADNNGGGNKRSEKGRQTPKPNDGADARSEHPDAVNKGRAENPDGRSGAADAALRTGVSGLRLFNFK
jgi:hypothetical protein